MASPDWTAVTAEVVGHLQALLQLDTTNPPGNESLAAEYLAGVLRAEGFEPTILEAVPGRGNLLVRLTGTGEQPPLLLYSHTDVVPAEPTYWTHPPFAGEVADGYVWGRGAADMKDTVAEQLMVMLLLKRQGIALKRDVIFAATADEEIGGLDGVGMTWLVKQHPDRLQAEFGLSEVGGYNMEFAGKLVYMVQVAEKGTMWLKVRAKGKPGHGSIPHHDNAVVHLTRAIQRLADQGLPYHLTDAAAGFLDATTESAGASPLGDILRSLKTEAGAKRAFATVLKEHDLGPFLYAMLHNTATPTGLTAGIKANVIPAMAEAVIDGRRLPGFDEAAFMAELRAVMGADLEYEVTMASPPLEAAHNTELYKLMAATLKAHDPATTAVVPYMMSGATDAKYLAPLGIPTYGFAPLKLPPDMKFMEMFHAHDERAPVEGLGWGVRVLYDVVVKYCS